MTSAEIQWPQFGSVLLAKGLTWRAGAPWRFEEKLDGVNALLTSGTLVLHNSTRKLPWTLPPVLQNCTLAGELVRGEFYAFDLLILDGQDIRQEPLRRRIAALADLLPTAAVPWLHPVEAGPGGEFLRAVLGRGGEGIVAKDLDAPYGRGWIKCKRIETHDCVVMEIHPVKQSIRLGQLDGGQMTDCGWCAVLGGAGLAWEKSRRVDRLKPGQVVEIECLARHPSGKFREPRFLRGRPDKIRDC
jgi:ATP-dependent DNA ligase